MNAEQARVHMAEQPSHAMIVQGDLSRCLTCDDSLPGESGFSAKLSTYVVKVSPELITELSTWSEPVQVMITRQANGEYDMIARRPESGIGE